MVCVALLDQNLVLLHELKTKIQTPETKPKVNSQIQQQGVQVSQKKKLEAPKSKYK